MTTAKLFVIVKILLAIILIGTICAVVLIIYLFKGDIKARVPGYVKKEYNLSKYEVENRPVYVMEPKEGVTNDLVIMYVHGGSYVADLEKELLEKINKLEIGPGGLGGKMTALGVNVEVYPTHIAGLPVAINMCCHVNRHVHRII